jgi:hypothetical protein
LHHKCTGYEYTALVPVPFKREGKVKRGGHRTPLKREPYRERGFSFFFVKDQM